jgi:hypothetical protein
MKKKKYILIIIVFLALLTTGIIFSFVKTSTKSFIILEKVPKALFEKSVKVSLIVFDKTYGIELREGSTVFDVMQKIQHENITNDLFNFKYKEYPSIGVFVEEINGVIGSQGKYWIYYVNGEKAEVGISKNIVKGGDIISWKQE